MAAWAHSWPRVFGSLSQTGDVPLAKGQFKFGCPFAKYILPSLSYSARGASWEQPNHDHPVKVCLQAKYFRTAPGVRRNKAALSSGCKSHPAALQPEAPEVAAWQCRAF